MKQWNKCSIGTHCCKYLDVSGCFNPDPLYRCKGACEAFCHTGICFNLTQFRTTPSLVLLANM